MEVFLNDSEIPRCITVGIPDGGMPKEVIGKKMKKECWTYLERNSWKNLWNIFRVIAVKNFDETPGKKYEVPYGYFPNHWSF